MKILQRARDIILNPRVTWQVVKDEEADIKQLFINYAVPLALIPAVCSFIGMALIGMRMPAGNMIRAPLLGSLLAGVVGYILNLAGVFVGGWVVKILAPMFKSKDDLPSAMRVVIYSLTPVWLVGIFSIVPGLGILSVLGLYGIYLLALGLPVVLDTPSDKVVWYTIAIILAAIVISFVLSAVIVGAFYGPMYMRMMAV